MQWVRCEKAVPDCTSFMVHFHEGIKFTDRGKILICEFIDQLRRRCDPNTDETMHSYEARITTQLMHLAQRGLVSLNIQHYDETRDKGHRCIIEKI